MSEAVIRAEGICKRYRVGERERYLALRDVITNAFKMRDRKKRPPKDFVWAVRDVSFEVKRGEVVGLIGRNGAGKTTLLKLLARITRPTSGCAELHGRIGSLLEVGTGFHPELTGRENIFLSGAILGMSKAEIQRKYDEIVAFAEVERFIDTPLKHFSAGMQMRLAFAVAAHLEPEILLVDEVLAVGDINFQKKCLGKMGDVARAGRTVVLVSHNMAAINALCSRCIILKSGSIEFDGPTETATARYYAESLDIVDGLDLSARPRKGNGKARFTSISIQPFSPSGRPVEVAYPGCDLSVNVRLACQAGFAPANLAIIFYDSCGYRIIDTNTAQKGEFVSLQADQVANACFLLREVLLRPGKYLVGLWLGRAHMETIDHIEDAASLDFVEHAESSRHTETFPGTYLCRFEQTVSVVQPSQTEIAGASGGLDGLSYRKARKALIRLLDRPGGRFLLGKIATRVVQRLGADRVEITFIDGFWSRRVGSNFFPDGHSFEYAYADFQTWNRQMERYVADAREYWLQHYIPREGDTIVDVGAGRGEDTAAFSRAVGKTGRVIAIEAHPLTFSILRKFCVLNGLTNVAALQLALMEKPRTVRVVESSSSWMENAVAYDEKSPGAEVRAVTLGEVCCEQGLKDIAFLKMNIEGAERFALPGADSVMPCIQQICVACHDFLAEKGHGEQFRTRTFVQQFLREHGFTVVSRPDDPRDYVRDHIFGLRPQHGRV